MCILWVRVRLLVHVLSLDKHDSVYVSLFAESYKRKATVSCDNYLLSQCVPT